MNKIKKLRVDRGLTLHELATQAGIGIASLARLEGDGKAYASTLGKIANALGVDVSELLEFEAISAKKESRLPAMSNGQAA